MYVQEGAEEEDIQTQRIHPHVSLSTIISIAGLQVPVPAGISVPRTKILRHSITSLL